MFFPSDNNIDKDKDKLQEKEAAGVKVIQAGTHNTPFLNHKPCRQDGKDGRDCINYDDTVSFSDGDQDVVGHVNCSSDGTAYKKNDKMQFIR